MKVLANNTRKGSKSYTDWEGIYKTDFAQREMIIRRKSESVNKTTPRTNKQL